MWKIYQLCLHVLLIIFSNLAYAEVKEIALTIDDLPFVGSANGHHAKLQREYDRLRQILQTLIDKKIPATGFVIAGSIEKGQWPLLEEFQQAGFVLGNHSYSHQSLHSISAEKYIQDLDKADKILTPLMTGPKYFRYPYLAEGSGHKKAQVFDYLTEHQYTIAPVTIDSKDFRFNQQLFAIPYRLREQRLGSLKQRYLAYIWKQTVKAENTARSHDKEKPIRQILLIHANLLNSHVLGDVIDLYQQNGYRFVSLAEVLKEPPVSTIVAPAP